MRISDWSSDVCSSDLLFFCRNVLWQPPQVLAIAAKPAVAASMSAASESFALAASIASADSSNSALSVQITGSAVVSTPAGALPAWNSGPNAAGIFAAAVLISPARRLRSSSDSLLVPLTTLPMPLLLSPIPFISVWRALMVSVASCAAAVRPMDTSAAAAAPRIANLTPAMCLPPCRGWVTRFLRDCRTSIPERCDGDENQVYVSGRPQPDCVLARRTIMCFRACASGHVLSGARGSGTRAPRRPGVEMLPVDARHPPVAAGDLLQLVPADDRVDVVDAARCALLDELPRLFRAVAAVGEDDARRRRPALGLVGGEGDIRVEIGRAWCRARVCQYV